MASGLVPSRGLRIIVDHITPTSILVGLTLLGATALDLSVVPHENHTVYYVVPVILAALRLPPGCVIITIFATTLDLAVISRSEFLQGNGPIAIASMALICFLAVRLCRLRIDAERRAGHATRSADLTTRMNTVAVALAAAVTPAHVAEAVVTHASVVGARAGTLVIRTSNPDELELVASSGYVSALTEPWRRFSLAAPTPLSEAVRRNAPVWVNSPEAARGRYPSGVFPQGNLAHNHAWAAVPLRLGDRVIGALGLAYQDEQTFTVDQQELLLTFAAQCAQALYRARLHEAEREARLVAEAAVRHRDEFLAVAAHELKTPMTSLRGFTQLELERYQRDATMYPKQTGHSLEIIDLQSGKLADMIVQLFDIAQIDTGKLVLQPQATNLTELVEQVVATFQNRLIHRSIVVDAVPTAIASIDPPRFEQVVTNLLDNAVKYSPEGTAIDVQITRPNDQIVRVSVRDRGRGIVLERRAHIFERYYQADRESPRSGMGLGLYICRQIVELHGGRIWAEFPENGGTRIVVSIPTEKPDETLS